MYFAITGIYASILTLLMIGLGARVSLLRAKTGISIMDGANKQLAERIRIHANLSENLPIAIILMAIAEAQGAGMVVMHAIGLMLLAGRLVHPLGIHFDQPSSPWRGIGITATAVSMLIAIVYILWTAIS